MLERPDYFQSLESVLDHARSIPAEEREARRLRAVQQDQEQYRQQVRERHLEICRNLSEIGPRFEERTIENFQAEDGNAEALDAVRQILDDFTLGAFIYGERPGNGKSHLAGAIVNAAMAAGISAVFTTGVRLLMRIRNTYTRAGNLRDGELDIVNRLIDVPVLVLDDLGTERFSDDTARLFYAIINGRYEGKRSIIVTANLSLAGLGMKWAESGVEEHLGNKLVDRMREMCTFKVQVTARSRRGAA